MLVYPNSETQELIKLAPADSLTKLKVSADEGFTEAELRELSENKETFY